MHRCGALVHQCTRTVLHYWEAIPYTSPYFKHRLFKSWPFLHTYYKIARVVELQLNMEWWKLRVLGSHWTLWPKKPEYFPPFSLPPPRSFCWSVWWENLHAFKNIFLFVRTDLSHCMSLKAGQHFLFNAEPFVSIYIAHKIHQNY